MIRLRHFVAACLFALVLGACARNTNPETAPVAQDTAVEPATPVAPAPAPTVEPAPAAEPAPAMPGKASPPPTIAVGEPNPSAPDVVDASCKTDADCAIKDVGSCCGYHPACVNTASPTFPDRVKAQCASSGRMSTCGFPAITGCTCHAGQCEGTGADAGAKVQ